MPLACKNCGSTNLHAEVTVKDYYPLAARRGSIKVGNRIISQMAVKDAWELEDGKPKGRKEPIICFDCEARYAYIVETNQLEPIA